MLSERLQNIFFAIAIIVMMYFCFTGVAKQFDHDNIRQAVIRPIYTESYIEELILEKIYYKKGFKEIEEIPQ